MHQNEREDFELIRLWLSLINGWNPLPPTVTKDENALLLPPLASNDDDDDWKTCCSNVSTQTESSSHHDLNREIIEISISKKLNHWLAEIHSNAFYPDLWHPFCSWLSWIAARLNRYSDWLPKFVVDKTHRYYIHTILTRERKKWKRKKEEKEVKGSTVKEWNGTKTSFSSDTPTRILFCWFLFSPTSSFWRLSLSLDHFRRKNGRKERVSIEIYWFSRVVVKNGKVWIEQKIEREAGERGSLTTWKFFPDWIFSPQNHLPR